MDRRDLLKLGALTVVGAAAGGVRVLAQPSHLPERGPDAGPVPRWAMVIKASACPANCTDCVQACHAGHNVPDFVTNPNPAVNNPRHEIKWIWREEFKHAFPGMETEFTGGLAKTSPLVLCNHCENPPCVRVCPTQATFKRSDGIVQMDYHRCIGCRFCVAACPYGSRSFNFRDPREAMIRDGRFNRSDAYYPTRAKGVVEKCNFCVERLADGLMPLCVSACTKGGLIFGDLNDPTGPVRTALAGGFSIRRKAELGTSPMVYYLV